jgi:predicted ferric reductase
MNLWWFLARAGGMVAWGMLGLSVLWGLAASTAILQQRRKPGWLLDLHSWLGGLAVTFTIIHVIALIGDEYVEFGLQEILVPLTSEWRPVAVAWGVVSLYLLIAIQLTSLLRRHLPKRLWRWVHLTSFVLFFTSGIHAGMAGTDTANLVYRWATVSLTSVTMVAIFYRVFAGTVRHNAQRARAASRPKPPAPPEPMVPRIPAAAGSRPASGSRQD